MTSGEGRTLRGAARDLEAARLLLEAGFTDQAVSRAYYAAFAAAEEALMALGETRSKHAGVISAFGALVVRDGGFDRLLGKVVGRLFRLRNEADYGAEDVPADTAEQAVDDAGRFVDGVRTWLAARSHDR